MSKYFVLMVVLIFGMTSLAHAGEAGGVSGGGGSAVVFDDRVVLADAFYAVNDEDKGIYQCPAGTKGNLNPKLWIELHRVLDILRSYGAPILDYSTGHAVSFPTLFEEWSQPISFLTATYCFVEKLPKEPEPLKIRLPEGSEVEGVAYTEGLMTFFRKDLFVQMSIREQAKLILHESLHRTFGGVTHEPIVQITNGIGVALELYQSQSESYHSKKTLPRLSNVQYESLKNMVSALERLKISTGKVQVERNGGGAYFNPSVIDKNAYISVGSQMPAGSRVSDRAIVLDSVVTSNGMHKTGDIRLKEGAQLLFSKITYSSINQDSLKVYFNKKSKMISSIVRFDLNLKIKPLLLLGPEALIYKSEVHDLETVLDARAALNNVDIRNNETYSGQGQLELKEGSLLIQSKLLVNHRHSGPLLFRGTSTDVYFKLGEGMKVTTKNRKCLRPSYQNENQRVEEELYFDGGDSDEVSSLDDFNDRAYCFADGEIVE